jgi:hypothetical protein
MWPVIVGIVLWLLLAAAAWRYSRIQPALDRYDRIGAWVFFIVIGVPVLISAMALIAHSTIA